MGITIYRGYGRMTTKQAFKYYFIAAALFNIFGLMACFVTHIYNAKLTMHKWLGGLVGTVVSSVMLGLVYVLCNIANIVALGVILFISYYLAVILFAVLSGKKRAPFVSKRGHAEIKKQENSGSLSREENMCFESIDNMWSWVNDDYLYNKFKQQEEEIRRFIRFRIACNDFPTSVSDQASLLTFVTLQSFAYSYYLVMDLKSSIPSNISINEVTNTMVEIFVENRYIGEERIADIDTINIMISQKYQIVAKTLGRLLANS